MRLYRTLQMILVILNLLKKFIEFFFHKKNVSQKLFFLISKCANNNINIIINTGDGILLVVFDKNSWSSLCWQDFRFIVEYYLGLHYK